MHPDVVEKIKEYANGLARETTVIIDYGQKLVEGFRQLDAEKKNLTELQKQHGTQVIQHKKDLIELQKERNHIQMIKEDLEGRTVVVEKKEETVTAKIEDHNRNLLEFTKQQKLLTEREEKIQGLEDREAVVTDAWKTIDAMKLQLAESQELDRERKEALTVEEVQLKAEKEKIARYLQKYQE